MSVTILHNPNCSKSRSTLALLEEQGITPIIRLYLKDSLDAKELAELMDMLAISSPREMMRSGEQDYKAQNLSNSSLSNKALLAAIAATPKLLERPVVINNGQARIGRPPENILDIV